MSRVTVIATILVMVLVAWIYHVTSPPPPKICGSPGNPPITASRIKLRDGRHLAYKEHGVPKELAEYKIIFAHGTDTSRHDTMIATTLSPEVLEEMKVYIVSFDRPGYGESDPDSFRSVKSMALDVEELADQLGLGSKFYFVGFSFGGMLGWGCLKYIPHRLAGAVLIAPAINTWWPGFPANLSKMVYDEQLPQDRWALRVMHHFPWLTYWWNTQKSFPGFSIFVNKLEVLSRQDMELVFSGTASKLQQEQIRQQGEFESLHRDLMIAAGTWEFDPMELQNPFPEDGTNVHLWQGDEDRLVSVTLQREIARRLPWIQYHEVAGAGHLLAYADGMSEAILKALLVIKN